MHACVNILFYVLIFPLYIVAQGCTSVKFRFVDPIYVWIQQCNVLVSKQVQLQWTPVSIRHPADNTTELYGSGIECGLLMRNACLNVPSYGRVALINLSWDGGGTGYSERSASPICIQVMNTNKACVDAVGLVGYVPKLEVPDSVFKANNERCRQASHHLIQTCVGLLLSCIERRARHGVNCMIGSEKMVLFPRLGAMSLDTPERIKYFGLRNMRSCGICRFRSGRSATRRSATRHDDANITALYTACTEVRDRAVAAR